MKTKLLFVILVLLLSAGISKAQGIVSERPSQGEYRGGGTDEKPSCPEGHLWRSSEWEWNKRADRYEKSEGKCMKAKKNHQWIPGHWARVAGGWKWEPGHWRKL